MRSPCITGTPSTTPNEAESVGKKPVPVLVTAAASLSSWKNPTMHWPDKSPNDRESQDACCSPFYFPYIRTIMAKWSSFAALGKIALYVKLGCYGHVQSPYEEKGCVFFLSRVKAQDNAMHMGEKKSGVHDRDEYSFRTHQRDFTSAKKRD